MLTQIETTIALSAALGIFAAANAGAATEPDTWVESEHAWQMELLFDPASSQQRSERKGRVFIYSDLKESVVDRALDEQFDRIDHMMFVRTVRTNADGEVKQQAAPDGTVLVAQDDDC